MPYAAIRQAVRARFEQFSDPRRPATVTALGGQGSRAIDSALSISLRLGGQLRPVLVYDTDKAGELADVWPAVSFQVGTYEEARRSNYLFHDPLARGIGTAFQHDRASGEERSGQDLVETLDHPDPIDIYLEIRAWSLDQVEGEQLKTLIKKLWPVTGALTYQQRDGSSVTVDFWRVRGPTWSGGLDPTLNAGDPGERFWSWTTTYLVEAYEDNTLETTLAPTVRRRTMEIGQAEQDDADVVEFDEHGRP